MKKIQYLLAPSILLAIFIIWTALVKVVDIQYVGAAGFLGFYSLNTQINNFVQSMNTKTFDLLTEHAVLSCFSHVQLFVTLQTVACQAPLSMGLSRQEFWSGLPCPPPRDLPDSGIKPTSPAMAGRFFIQYKIKRFF